MIAPRSLQFTVLIAELAADSSDKRLFVRRVAQEQIHADRDREDSKTDHNQGRHR